MHFRLDLILETAALLGFNASKPSADRVLVLVAGATLEFLNDPAGEDTLLGFEGTAWHTHGSLVVVSGGNRLAEYDEAEVLHALANGELVVRSSWKDGALLDRWISHYTEALRDATSPSDEEVREWRANERGG